VNWHAGAAAQRLEVDTRGLIYTVDRFQGFDILESDDSR
jgi:hypothetical protein